VPGLLILPAAPLAGALAYAWVDPQGVVHSLSSDPNVNVKVGERGLGIASIDLAEDKRPFLRGSDVRHAATQPLDTELEFLLKTSTSADLDALREQLYGWFATASESSLTPGYLRVTRRDGTVRQRAYYYVSGLEGDFSAERLGAYWQTLTVQLRAADPVATDIADTTQHWELASLPTLAALNAGDQDAFPVWTLSGPLTSATFTSTALGKSFAFIFNLVTGKQVVIDTRPASLRPGMSVYDSDGVNRFSALGPNPDDPTHYAVWHLVPGANAMTVTMTGAVFGQTTLDLAYLQQYRALR
jgi:hypothetical protein